MSILIKTVLSFGPGIFAIGYTTGTGSVTSMIVAGSTFGMELLWVLVLSCLFSGALIFAYGNIALVTGDTALHAFKQHLPLGRLIGILIIVGVTSGQWNSPIGIVGISSNIIYELIPLYFPAVGPYKYGVVIAIATIVFAVMYSILLNGKYSVFERILVFFVTIMGFSFIMSLTLVHPLAIDVARGLLPSIPDVPGGKMMVAAFVGTTMAAATFLSWPLFIQGSGWTMDKQAQQRKDAIIAAILVFVVSASIMSLAHGARYQKQEPAADVLGMVGALEPIAGNLALTIPVLGFNPVKGQILTQVFNVFVLPPVVAGIIVVIDNCRLMGSHAAGYILNTLLGLAFLFSMLIAYNEDLAIYGQLV